MEDKLAGVVWDYRERVRLVASAFGIQLGEKELEDVAQEAIEREGTLVERVRAELDARGLL